MPAREKDCPRRGDCQHRSAGEGSRLAPRDWSCGRYRPLLERAAVCHVDQPTVVKPPGAPRTGR